MVKTIKPYAPPPPPKPYAHIALSDETRAEFDNLFQRILAARDEMRLVQVPEKGGDQTGGGLCIISDEHMALFYHLKNNKPHFFWAEIGMLSFGLKNPEPGQYWTFGSWGAMWFGMKDPEHEPRRTQLHQSFSANYPEIKDKSGKGGKGGGSGGGSGGESGDAAVTSPGAKPIKTLTETDLKLLGF